MNLKGLVERMKEHRETFSVRDLFIIFKKVQDSIVIKHPFKNALQKFSKHFVRLKAICKSKHFIILFVNKLLLFVYMLLLPG